MADDTYTLELELQADAFRKAMADANDTINDQNKAFEESGRKIEDVRRRFDEFGATQAQQRSGLAAIALRMEEVGGNSAILARTMEELVIEFQNSDQAVAHFDQALDLMAIGSLRAEEAVSRLAGTTRGEVGALSIFGKEGARTAGIISQISDRSKRAAAAQAELGRQMRIATGKGTDLERLSRSLSDTHAQLRLRWAKLGVLGPVIIKIFQGLAVAAALAGAAMIRGLGLMAEESDALKTKVDALKGAFKELADAQNKGFAEGLLVGSSGKGVGGELDQWTKSIKMVNKALGEDESTGFWTLVIEKNPWTGGLLFSVPELFRAIRDGALGINDEMTRLRQAFKRWTTSDLQFYSQMMAGNRAMAARIAMTEELGRQYRVMNAEFPAGGPDLPSRMLGDSMYSASQPFGAGRKDKDKRRGGGRAKTTVPRNRILEGLGQYRGELAGQASVLEMRAAETELQIAFNKQAERMAAMKEARELQKKLKDSFDATAKAVARQRVELQKTNAEMLEGQMAGNAWGQGLIEAKNAMVDLGHSFLFAAGEALAAGDSLSAFGNTVANLVASSLASLAPAFTALGQGLLAWDAANGVGLIMAGAAMSFIAGAIKGGLGDKASPKKSTAASRLERAADRLLRKEDTREERVVNVYLGDKLRPTITQTVNDGLNRGLIRPGLGWRRI